MKTEDFYHCSRVSSYFSSGITSNTKEMRHCLSHFLQPAKAKVRKRITGFYWNRNHPDFLPNESTLVPVSDSWTSLLASLVDFEHIPLYQQCSKTSTSYFCAAGKKEKEAKHCKKKNGSRQINALSVTVPSESWILDHTLTLLKKQCAGLGVSEENLNLYRLFTPPANLIP